MTNFKALGIEKHMAELFNSLEESEHKILEESEYFICPSISTRKPNMTFCDIILTDCQYKDWWYRNLIGMKFNCVITLFKNKHTNQNYIYSIHGVRAVGNKVIKFRSFDPKDISII